MTSTNEASLTTEQLLAAVLAVLVADREDRLATGEGRPAESRKTEVVLAGSGLNAAQIGKILDKKPDTVAKTISRAKAKTSGS